MRVVPHRFRDLVCRACRSASGDGSGSRADRYVSPLPCGIELLVDDLSELFGRHVDLVSRRSLHPVIRASVEADARAIYAA